MANLLRGRATERGIVGVNLVLVICFALYAVIMLSSVTLSAKQIDDHVKVIVTEVGPGSNVARLDQVAILDTVADRADQILAAAKPLSGQANEILVTAKSIDNTVHDINGTAKDINGVVNSINGKASGIQGVVNEIRGTPGTPSSPGVGTTSINMRADNIINNVNGIQSDLHSTQANTSSIDAHTYSINCGAIAGVLMGQPAFPCPPPAP
jgi:hypothetical protein